MYLQSRRIYEVQADWDNEDSASKGHYWPLIKLIIYWINNMVITSKSHFLYSLNMGEYRVRKPGSQFSSTTAAYVNFHKFSGPQLPYLNSDLLKIFKVLISRMKWVKNTLSNHKILNKLLKNHNKLLLIITFILQNTFILVSLFELVKNTA